MGRLWCANSNRIAVWPSADNLHEVATAMSPRITSVHNTRACSVDSGFVSQSLAGNSPVRRGFRGRVLPAVPSRRGTPNRPPRTPELPKVPIDAKPLPRPIPLHSSTDSGNNVSEERRQRKTFRSPPVLAPALLQRSNTVGGDTGKNDCANPIDDFVSPRKKKKDRHNRQKSVDGLDIKSDGDKEKRRKRRVIASYGDEEQKVSRNINLSKLVGIIPGLELDMIDEDHPVQITCSRVNGELKIHLSCPNGLPEIPPTPTESSQ